MLENLKPITKNSILISKPFGHIRSNSLLFMERCLLYFFYRFTSSCIINAGLNELNKKLLSYFSTYYLWVGLITVFAALIILVLPLRKQRLGEEKPAYSYFSWVAYCIVYRMGSGLCACGSRACLLL
jgi:glycine betaine transporter